MEYWDKEEANLYLTINHQDDEVTSHFSYQDLFRIYKKLTKEGSELEPIISTSKEITSSLELKNKNLFREIKSLRERKYDLIQNYSSSHKALNKSVKCDQCDILKNKMDDLQNTLDKFTKGQTLWIFC